MLAQEGGISWMNARHPHSGGSFIIATAVSDEEEERATRLLKNEFALRDHLQDNWAIRAVASTQYRGRFALVLDKPRDPGDRPARASRQQLKRKRRIDQRKTPPVLGGGLPQRSLQPRHCAL